MKTSLLSLMALAGALCAPSAQADTDDYYYHRPATHQGMQLRGTLGVGFLSNQESIGGQWQDTISGTAGQASLYVGGSLAPGFFLGGFVSGTGVQAPTVDNGSQLFYTSSDTRLNIWTVGPYLDIYPYARGGFHLLGGVGYTGISISSYQAGTLASGDGVSVHGGVGLDMWVNREMSMGFLLSLTHSTAIVQGFYESTYTPVLSLSISYH